MNDQWISHPFEATGVSVGTGGLTTIITIQPSDIAAQLDIMHGMVQFELQNTGGQVLTDFAIEQQDHANAAEWYKYLAAGDWAFANGNDRLLSVSAVLDTLGGGTNGHATVALHAATAIRFGAQRGISATTVSIRGMLLLQPTL